MREEKRRRTRDEESSAAKKKRDDSPTPHFSTSIAPVTKSRCHMPVSERQQFALLKLMEAKYSLSDRGSRQVWEGQEREVCESEKSPPSPAFTPCVAKGQSTATPTATATTAVGGTSSRYNSPYQESGSQVERLTSSRCHSHSHHGHGHSSSSHHSGARKASFQQQHRNSGSDLPLMRAAKKGDLLTLKMMVKEGADVNEHDINGRTALHESSQQNFFHVVSYLLKHNANPNVRALGTGDTPLHEASREGHIRIIRVLLRYGADPKICNTNGDRPTNLCPNEASQLVFKQTDHPSESSFVNSKRCIAASRNATSNNQSRDLPNTLAASSMPIKKSPPPPPPLEGHHRGWSSFAEEQAVSTCIKRRSSPDPSNSSPSCGQTQQSHSSNSPHPHSHHHHHKHHSPSTGRRNTVSGPVPSIGALSAESIGSIHELPKLASKKDPYAFDDEEVELTAQPNQESATLVSTNQSAPSSTSPLQPHRFSTTFAFSATANAAVSSLHINTVPSDSLHSGPSSSVSPSAIGGVGGPPLKIRFAMEAGHYTVMDNQENPTEQATPVVAALTSVAAAAPTQEEENSITQVEDSNRGMSLESLCKPESADQNPLVLLEAIIHPDSDDDRSPKVPPLRIKLGNSTPPPSQSHQFSSPLTVDLCHTDNVDTVDEPTLGVERKQDSNDDDSICAMQSQLKPEPSSEMTEVKDEGGGQSGSEVSKLELDELGLTLTGDDEEKKSAEVAFTSSGHQVKRGTGGGGKVAKLTSSNETSSLKRHAAAEMAEVKLRDVCEETPKTRTSRTLRSHTAAQREKKEREKHSDVAPLKKRKYRSKGGSGAEGGGGNEVDAGKSTDHEDAGTTNEASSLRSGSTNGDTTAIGAVEDDAQSPVGEPTTSFFCSRVFDDPNKPSVAGWGENPYEKAAELNRGLSDLIGKLVELQPKEPAGYQDYLLVTRDYLFAGNVSQHNSRRQCPAELPQTLVELFEEQEDERYAQALKHQSEREQLRLCAEQSILRAQTRATIALANQPRPLSFCSVMALKGFTYLPPFKDPEHRDEESVRDRFKARTLIGWLQDIKDNFHLEKKKLLCRQLHEAESLMMVQKLDWEVKLKELHLYDFRTNIFDQIPNQYVPLIGVPRDFPLFVHDPIQRPS